MSESKISFLTSSWFSNCKGKLPEIRFTPLAVEKQQTSGHVVATFHQRAFVVAMQTQVHKAMILEREPKMFGDLVEESVARVSIGPAFNDEGYNRSANSVFVSLPGA